MSSPATLRNICIKKTCYFLGIGVWDNLEENPFSCMPSSVVESLLSFLWPAESRLRMNSSKVSGSHLLLTSGTLEHVYVPNAEVHRDNFCVFRALSCSCQNVRTLSVFWKDPIWAQLLPTSRQRDVNLERAQLELLQNCSKLEHLHTFIYFDPQTLRKFTNLKSLRLHFDSADEIKMFFLRINSDLLKSLPFIEVLALCKRRENICEDDERCLIHATAAILVNCPQLTSLGFLESLTSLEYLYSTKCKVRRQFKLHRCYWGGSRLDTMNFLSSASNIWPTGCTYFNATESDRYHSLTMHDRAFLECSSHDWYCDRIRVSALSCPLTEVLVITVPYAAALQHLKVLTKLTCLVIKFPKQEKDYRQEFYSLLDEIGPQLRHLSICGYNAEPLSLNVLCRSCPNLRTLKLLCETTADQVIEPCVSLLNLERLCARNCDRKSLLFILSNCLELKVVCLSHCMELEDFVLLGILLKNPFAELEVALIDGCSLSESGWRRFVQSAFKLSKCCLRSDSLRDYDWKQYVRDLNPSAVCRSSEFYQELELEQFPNDFNSPCWL